MKGNFYFWGFFILLFTYVLCQDNENYEENENDEEDNYNNFYNSDPFNKFKNNNIINIKNYNDYLINIKNTTNGKSTIFVIYSNSCPHCRDFAPNFINISNHFINNKNITFLRINSNVYDTFSDNITEFKIYGVPSIFLYTNEKFIEYKENRDVNYFVNYINQQHNFKCEEINENILSELINDDILLSNNNNKSFIIGLFPKINNQSIESNIEIFQKLNSRQGDLIRSSDCFYFLYDNDILNKSNEIKFLTLNEGKNYIYVYNSQKGIKNFPYFENKYLSLNFSDVYMKQIESKYIEFIKLNFFPYYILFEDSLISKILSLNKKLLLFLFENDNEKQFYIQIINQLLGNKTIQNNYFMILINKTDEKLSISKYYKETAVYYTKQFETDEIIIVLNKNKSLSEQFDILDKIKEFINNNNRNDEEVNSNELLKNNVQKGLEIIKDIFKLFIDEDKKNSTENINYNKTEERNGNKTLENNNKTNKFLYKNLRIKNQEKENKKGEKDKIHHFNIFLYLIIYSILFYFFYKKYLITEEYDPFKSEIKEIKNI